VTFAKKEQKISLEVSPNPATDGKIRFILRGGINEHLPTDMALTDLYGRLIVQKNGRVKADMPYEMSLENGFLAAGVYILSCQNGATRLIQKIVIP
jgi:hypothetical protein